MREWNPLWIEVVEDDMISYAETVHNMIIASINWVEAHSELKELKWDEKNKRNILRSMGVSDNVDEDEVILMGYWHTFFRPNEETVEWFDVMITACDSIPTIHMMEKALICGVLLKRKGWDYFNIFMLGIPEDKPH